ncbi:MAG: YabP/YqfC family sporulation protein [Christensenellales bacterium]|nr:hypothetical protein [Clostridia bacterium]
MGKFDGEVAKILDLELAALVNSFKYSVYGNHTVVVEGHKGLVSFSSERIVFKLGKTERLEITGEEISIKQLTKNFTVVTGKIKGVSNV